MSTAITLIDDLISYTKSVMSQSNSNSTLSFDRRITLNDGVTIPQVGFGTFELARALRHVKSTMQDKEMKDEDTETHDTENLKFENSIRDAIRFGYRHIDTAHAYDTERLIGNALAEIYREGTVKREDLFITTKFHNKTLTADYLRRAVFESCRNLRTAYIDLYLVHSCHSQLDENSNDYGSDAIQIYRELLYLKSLGKIRSVGVSNWGIKHLEALQDLGLPLPSVNQLEIHPFLIETERELIDYCIKKGIKLEAYSPIARANEKARNSTLLKKLGEKYNKSWAQIMLRWGLQNDFIILPKSVTRSRIEQNTQLFDFNISDEDMKSMKSLSQDLRTCWNPMIIKWGDHKKWKFNNDNNYLNINTTVPLDGDINMAIPLVGLGTFEMGLFLAYGKRMRNERLTNEEEKAIDEGNKATKVAVRYGLVEAGYRHIDTAQVYGNEAAIGEALTEVFNDKNNSLQRKDVWITTKFGVVASSSPYDVFRVVNESLKALQTDYIDLYLLHSPHSKLEGDRTGSDVIQAYTFLLKLKSQGKIRSVGVSNFNVEHLEVIRLLNLPLPSVNQIEITPFNMNRTQKIIDYCKRNNIMVEAYTPLGRVDKRIVENEIVQNIAKKHNTSWSQVLIRWSIQNGFICLPKSSNPKRISSNIDLYSFSLDSTDLKQLTSLASQDIYKCWRGSVPHPYTVKWGNVNRFSIYSLNRTILLNDGVEIPQLGFGTYEKERTIRHITTTLKNKNMEDEDLKKHNEEMNTFKNAIKDSIKYGYRHIDTAAAYDTERIIGDALQEVYKTGVVKREDLFITSKHPMRIVKPSTLIEGVMRSLEYLQTSYIDLYLIHSPHSHAEENSNDYGRDTINVYKDLLYLKAIGKIRSIGVSNFNVQHLEIMEKLGLPLPSVNQIEIHPFLIEKELIQYCRNKNIVLEAYSPIARADEKARTNTVLKKLGEKYNKSWAQIMLRWGLQEDFVILPKSVTSSRIEQNTQIYDFELTSDDLKLISSLSKENLRTCWNPLILKWGDFKNWKFNTYYTNINERRTLNDGVQIPILGYGTGVPSRCRTHIDFITKTKEVGDKLDLNKLTDEDKNIINGVKLAVQNGYRQIDTAQIYNTEILIGIALKELFESNVVKREDLFITSKIPPNSRTPETVRDSVVASLKQLGIKYIDLYLIHSTLSVLDRNDNNYGRDVVQQYKVLQDLKKEGLIKSVGVSNFNVRHLEVLRNLNLPLPSVNQIEISPFLMESELIDYCRRNNILLQAYCPLGRSDKRVRENPLLNEIAKSYNVTWSQIMLRWSLQSGFIPVPKSVTEKYIKSNADVFSFEISSRDMERLNGLSSNNFRMSWNPLVERWGNYRAWKL